MLRDKVHDSRKFWHTMRDWGFVNKNSGNTLTSDELDTNEVNKYFLECAEGVLADNLLPNYFYEKADVKENLLFEEITIEETEKHLSDIKSNATGMDGISTHMLKLCFPYCKRELCHIINVSLKKPALPLIWKTSKIIPLQKKNNCVDLKNLRPISILPAASKILEKAVYRQTYGYLMHHEILSQSQSGFRKLHSTGTALLKINDDIIQAWDKNLITVVVLLDMSKAFDSLDHELLLSKLFYYGIQGIPWEWYCQYLVGRRQCVELGGHSGPLVSNTEVIKKGVPQGSILGPLLFNIFMVDLEKHVKHCKFHSYADDVQLMMSFEQEDIEVAFNQINEDLQGIL